MEWFANLEIRLSVLYSTSFFNAMIIIITMIPHNKFGIFKTSFQNFIWNKAKYNL